MTFQHFLSTDSLLTAFVNDFAAHLSPQSPQRFYCEDPFALIVGILAAASRGENVELLPCSTENCWTDSAILPLLHGENDASPPVLQDIDLILSTSGSSGERKKINKKLSAMFLEGEMLAKFLSPYPQKSRLLATVSVQHLYGLTFRCFLPLLSHWQEVGEQYRYPELLLHASAGEENPPIWITSPTFLQTLVAGHDLQQWQNPPALIITAGGVLNPQLAQQLREKIPVLDVYGSTETGVIAADFGVGRKPFPTVETKRDKDGILHVCSPWSGGWQKTNDVVDADFSLFGRADRMIKRGDKRLSLDTIEQILQTLPEIADSYCALHPDNQRLCAWLALTPLGIEKWREKGRKFCLAEWQKVLASQYERLAVPRYFRVTTALSRNSQGKIARADFLSALQNPILTPTWQITDNKGEHFSACAHVPLDLEYLKGHFDKIALVPGVIQCKWAQDLGAKYFDLTAPVIEIEQLKFQQFLRPHDLLTITLKYDATRGKLHFTCHNGTGKCASGRFVYQSEQS